MCIKADVCSSVGPFSTSKLCKPVYSGHSVFNKSGNIMNLSNFISREAKWFNSINSNNAKFVKLITNYCDSIFFRNYSYILIWSNGWIYGWALFTTFLRNDGILLCQSVRSKTTLLPIIGRGKIVKEPQHKLCSSSFIRKQMLTTCYWRKKCNNFCHNKRKFVLWLQLFEWNLE